MVMFTVSFVPHSVLRVLWRPLVIDAEKVTYRPSLQTGQSTAKKLNEKQRLSFGVMAASRDHVSAVKGTGSRTGSPMSPLDGRC